MAGMVAFGRRWSIATDDFLFIGIIDGLFFVVWLCCISVWYAYFLRTDCVCRAEIQCTLLHVFLIGVLLLTALNFFFSLAFIVCASRGTVSQPEPREPVVTLVYFKTVIGTLDVVFAILGSVLLRYRYDCPGLDANFVVKIITAFSWLIFGIRLIFVWAIYDTKGKTKKHVLGKLVHNEYFPAPVQVGYAKKWKNRLWAMFFCLTDFSTDRNTAISTAAELLAFLTEDLDLVLSDFLCGLLLYRRYSMEKYEDEVQLLESSASITLADGSEVSRFPLPDMKDWMNLKLASHYFRVGMGIFGWPWVIYRNLSCGLCHICRRLVCCLPCLSRYSNVEGDNCCGCNLAGLRYTSKYRYEDLVHVSFKGKIYEVPFFVSVDEETRSIVLVLRGSMSLSDALTDVSASLSPLTEPGFPKDALCHGGMLLASRRVLARLEEKKVLETAFSGREDYHLVVTGHSLGAGVSTFLALFLKNSYPNTRCFAFAPPCTVNSVMLPEMLDDVFTIIYGNDVIPFLSFANVRRCLVNICRMLEECKEPKHKVLFRCFKGLMCWKKEQKRNVPENGDDQNIIEVPAGADVDEGRGPDVDEDSSAPSTRLFAPGRILHIRKSSKGYRLRMGKADDYDGILLRPQMLRHHFPEFLEVSLQRLGKTEAITSDDLMNVKD